MNGLEPAVFLDRDGVVIEDAHYLSAPERIRLIPGSAEAIAMLNRAGWKIAIVTNQSGVARGLFSIEMVTEINRHVVELLKTSGARVDGVYVCPHHPEADIAQYRLQCECRKPLPGMLLRAARDLRIDLAHSWMIGDRLSDLQAGAAAGCRTVLVRTGYGGSVNILEREHGVFNLQLIAANLAEAVRDLGLDRGPHAVTPFTQSLDAT